MYNNFDLQVIVENRKIKNFAHREEVHTEVEYHPDTSEVINNGAKISLVHWKMDRFLNSHNVASPTEIRNSEVSGFSNFRKKSKTKVLNEVTCFLN